MTGLRKRWSSLLAVTCIALGTAALSAVLALVNATLWEPLPFPDSQRLVRIWNAQAGGDPRIDLSMPEMAELAQSLRGVEAFAGAARSRIVARLPGGAERLRGEAIDTAYFELLGMQAGLGRLFSAEDYAADNPPTLLLSHAVWTSRYGADPGVIGQTLAAGDTAFRIVGVLPHGFDGTIENDVVDFWIPQAHYQPATLRQERGARLGWTLARLAPGISIEAFQAELDALQARRLADFPAQYAQLSLRTEPFGENWRAPLRRNAAMMMAAVFVLLAIAVSNVAALLLARALDRKRELALRSALGASRSRIAWALLVETGRLALLGGMIGALAAPFLLEALMTMAPLTLPGYLAMRFDGSTVLLVTAALGTAALTAALVPAWLGSRVAPQTVIASEGRSSAGSGDRRVWNGLMSLQIALSFALLVAGALLLRSYAGLASVDLGFRTGNVLRLALSLAESDFGTPAQLAPLYRRLHDELAAQPGVLQAGLVAPTLPPWDADRPELRHASLQLADDEDGLRVGSHRVDDALLATLDIPLLAGRGIAAGDDVAAPRVAVVSAALAQRLGGAERAIGSEIELTDERPNRPDGRYRVVGVAGDVAWDGLAEQDTGRYIRYGANDDTRGARHDIYLALAQHATPVVSIAVHTALPPEQMIEPLRRVLSGIAPASALHWVSAMDDELAGEYAASRFYLTLILVFGLAALLLAAVGLFALLSHALLKRQHEIGIRLALGADTARLARLVLADSARLLTLGLGGGLMLSLAGSRLMESSLYGISAYDPLAWLVAAALIAVVAVLAHAWPLRRALAIPPTQALRAD